MDYFEVWPYVINYYNNRWVSNDCDMYVCNGHILTWPENEIDGIKCAFRRNNYYLFSTCFLSLGQDNIARCYSYDDHNNAIHSFPSTNIVRLDMDTIQYSLTDYLDMKTFQPCDKPIAKLTASPNKEKNIIYFYGSDPSLRDDYPSLVVSEIRCGVYVSGTCIYTQEIITHINLGKRYYFEEMDSDHGRVFILKPITGQHTKAALHFFTSEI